MNISARRWCAGRRGGAGPDGTFLPAVPREPRGGRPACWTMYFASSHPGKRRSFKETEDKGRWMRCHQPDHRALGDPPRPFCHSGKGDRMCHAESGCPYLFGRVRVRGCTATSVPGHLAQGPVVRACLWEADGGHRRLVCSAVAGPLPPRAQLGCTQAGSAALRGRCRPRTWPAAPCARSSGC